MANIQEFQKKIKAEIINCRKAITELEFALMGDGEENEMYVQNLHIETNKIHTSALDIKTSIYNISIAIKNGRTNISTER